MSAMPSSWPDVLTSALLGTARSGGRAEALLDAAAGHALRRRAGVALVPGAQPPAPAPADDALPVGPAAAARADALLAPDGATRGALPVRDTAGRLELLAEWLAAAAAANRRLPAELVPALLDAGRRHRTLQPLTTRVAGPLAGWLAAQRADWSYVLPAGPARSTVDDVDVWELGSIGRRVDYLGRMRRRDPALARELVVTAWEDAPPEDRVALLGTLHHGLSTGDEPLLERALDDRRKQVRDLALDLLARLPDSAYARRMAARSSACIDLRGTRGIDINPPAACDRSMRRDGIAPRPPAGIGERAWWLEEILARTPLDRWPEPRTFLAREVSEGWAAAVRRGLARAAAAQRHGAWAAALVDPVAADVVDRGHPADRPPIEALYQLLPIDDLASRATAALRRGSGGATPLPGRLACNAVEPAGPSVVGVEPAGASVVGVEPAGASVVGVERLLSLCPRPWPAAVAEAVLGALDDRLGRRGADWRLAGLCEVAALRLPADLAPRVTALVERLRGVRPNDPGLAVAERLSATLRFRRDMLEELA